MTPAPIHSVSIEVLLLWVSALLLAAVLASRASGKLGIPSLLLFLGIGMLAGEEGPGGIPFDDARLAQSLGVVALVLILYAGGVDTRWASVSQMLWKGLSLSTIGVLVTAGAAGAFAAYCLRISLAEGFLLGAIVSSTDAAAVFSVLRSRGAALGGGIGPLLELESGSNDPMAVFLTVALIRLLTVQGASFSDLAVLFVLQMAVGLATGYASGRFASWLLNHIKLQADGLYPVLSLALVLLTYSGASVLKGNGFLAVYVAGIVMGNTEFIHKKSLARFHDALAWLMQIVMFLTLGLLVYPSRLVPVAGVALLIACFLMLVARPASVFLSLAFARVPLRHRLMISWVGLRGAVPIILATFPLLAGIRDSDLFFNVVFFIVLTSVLLQGTTLSSVGRWLGVSSPAQPYSASPLEFSPGLRTRSQMIEMPIPPASALAGKQLVEAGFPKSALVVLITRGDQHIVPRGDTVVREGDRLLVLVEAGAAARVASIVAPAV